METHKKTRLGLMAFTFFVSLILLIVYAVMAYDTEGNRTNTYVLVCWACIICMILSVEGVLDSNVTLLNDKVVWSTVSHAVYLIIMFVLAICCAIAYGYPDNQIDSELIFGLVCILWVFNVSGRLILLFHIWNNVEGPPRQVFAKKKPMSSHDNTATNNSTNHHSNTQEAPNTKDEQTRNPDVIMDDANDVENQTNNSSGGDDDDDEKANQKTVQEVQSSSSFDTQQSNCCGSEVINFKIQLGCKLILRVVVFIMAILLVVQASTIHEELLFFTSSDSLGLEYVVIDLGGWSSKMNVRCVGVPAVDGSPSIWVESAEGMGIASFIAVQDSLKDKGYHVCTYDRSGYGFSTRGSFPRSLGKNAQELYALLNGMGLATQSFVCVGHGGAGTDLCRRWLNDKPEQVVGMVQLNGYCPSGECDSNALAYRGLTNEPLATSFQFAQEKLEEKVHGANVSRWFAPLTIVRWMFEGVYYVPAEYYYLFEAGFAWNVAWDTFYFDLRSLLEFPFTTQDSDRWTNPGQTNIPLLVVEFNNKCGENWGFFSIGCSDDDAFRQQLHQLAEVYTNTSTSGALVQCTDCDKFAVWQTPNLIVPYIEQVMQLV